MSEYKNYRDKDLQFPIRSRGDGKWANHAYDQGVRAISKDTFFKNFDKDMHGFSYSVGVLGDYTSFAKRIWEGSYASNPINSLWVNGAISDVDRYAIERADVGIWVDPQDERSQKHYNLLVHHLAIVPSEPQETFKERTEHFLQRNAVVVVFDEKVNQEIVQDALKGKEGFLPAMLREQDDSLVFVYRGQRRSEQ